MSSPSDLPEQVRPPRIQAWSARRVNVECLNYCRWWTTRARHAALNNETPRRWWAVNFTRATIAVKRSTGGIKKLRKICFRNALCIYTWGENGVVTVLKSFSHILFFPLPQCRSVHVANNVHCRRGTVRTQRSGKYTLDRARGRCIFRTPEISLPYPYVMPS